MKSLVIVFSFLVGGIFLSACKNNGTGQDENISSDPIKINLSAAEQQMTDEGQNFAANLLSIVNELQTSDENIVLSPLSLNMALAMTWNGANGETKQAMQKAMGMSNYSDSDVNNYFQKLRDALLKTDPTVKLAIANSIWTRQGFPVKSSFYDVNKNYYAAEVKEVDFSDAKTPGIINQWCSDNTNGLIKEMIDKISPEAIMYLINALYFKGEWANRFDASNTRNAAFTKEDGSSIQVRMMNQDHIFTYYQNDSLSMTALPFGNNAFSMVFFLPAKNISLTDLINQLKQPGYFEKCLYSGMTADVDLYVPSFKIEYGSISLKKTLEQLGMDIAFSDFADFSGISDTPLCISDVLQKTSVSIDEKGGEAAAVTVVVMVLSTAGGPPPTPPKVVFRADHPFLFAIRENSTGAVLFIGKIGNPGN